MIVTLTEIRLAADVGGLNTSTRGKTRNLISIDAPKMRDGQEGGILFSGWFVPQSGEVGNLRLTSPGEFCIDVVLGVHRRDVQEAAAEYLPGRDIPSLCGFRVSLLPASEAGPFEWTLGAVDVTGREVSVATICGNVSESTQEPTRDAPRRKAGGILVAGFHRTGTSMFAQMLRSAGIPLGRELVPPLLSNPDGHFEDCWAVDLNAAILASNRETWQWEGEKALAVSADQIAALKVYCERRAQESRIWAVKDPRLGAVLQAWRIAAPLVNVLVPVRNAVACARSLRRRQAAEIAGGLPPSQLAEALKFWIDPDLPYRMWVAHHENVLLDAAKHPGRVRFIELSQLSERPESVFERLFGSVDVLSTNPVKAELLHGDEPRVAPGEISPRTLSRIRAVGVQIAARGGGRLPRPIEQGDLGGEEREALARLDSVLSALPFTGATQADSQEPTAATDSQHSILDLATRYADCGDWLTAKRLADGAEVLPQQQAMLDLVRARVCAGTGDWKHSLALHARLLSGDPRSVDAMLGVMEALLVTGDVAGAADVVENFLHANPAEPWPWQRCGRTVIRLNDESLLADFARALASRCVQGDGNWIAVRAMWEMRRGNLPVAQDLLADTANPVPKAGTPFAEALVECELRQGRLVEARRLTTAMFLAAHDRQGYQRYITSVLTHISSGPMRLSLIRGIVAELEMHLAESKPRAAAVGTGDAGHRPPKDEEVVTGYFKRLIRSLRVD